MIDAKQAASIARNYLLDIYGEENPADIQVEEIEWSDDNYWYVTLGFRPRPPSVLTKYKVFKIDPNAGKVVSMKMREAA